MSISHIKIDVVVFPSRLFRLRISKRLTGVPRVTYGIARAARNKTMYTIYNCRLFMLCVKLPSEKRVDGPQRNRGQSRQPCSIALSCARTKRSTQHDNFVKTEKANNHRLPKKINPANIWTICNRVRKVYIQAKPFHSKLATPSGPMRFPERA